MASRYLVVGLGITGQSVLRYCERQHIVCIAYDTRETLTDLPLIQKTYPSLEVYLNTFPDDVLKQIDTLVVSPGVSLEIPLIQKAKALGLPVIGDVELFAKTVTKPVIAITGTNGKSTVTSMVGDIIKAAGYSVAVCGNIGEPVLDTLLDPHDVWVLELSSFQLESVFSLHPDVACILNVAPDHLDRHHDFSGYVKSKKRIYHGSHYQVYCASDVNTVPDKATNPLSFDFSEKAECGLIQKQGVSYLALGREPLMSCAELKIKGQHNVSNALAAMAITHAFGVEPPVIKQALMAFQGLLHRCQWIKEENDIGWVNDSKGTNVGATLAAISGLGPFIKGKLIWIAGGEGKGADFSPLALPVQSFARLVILMGADKEKIANELKENTKIRYVNSMAEAVLLAKTYAQPGDCVLLSPACASFDMFDNFVHRGDVFMTTVLAN